MNMQLTKNFTLQEMVQSPTARKKGIDNTPTDKVTGYLKALCETVLQPIRDEWGEPIIVTSGYRCPKLNVAIGGAKNSDHMFGAAADIKTKSDKPEDNKRLFQLIIAMKDQGKIKCRQIIDEYSYDWIHVSINNEHNANKNNQVLHIK